MEDIMKEKKHLLMAKLNQLEPNNPSYVLNIRTEIQNSGYELDWKDEEENGDTLLMSLVSGDLRYMRIIDEDENIDDFHKRSIINEIILLGADLNIQNNDGDTALIIACGYYDHESKNSIIISELLKKKADVNIKNKYGKTALFYGRYNETNHQLLAAGADINSVDNKGQTVLYNVNVLHLVLYLDFLLQLGANPNHQDNDGNTPLIHWCKNMQLFDSKQRRIFVINKLISRGADVNVKNGEGNTALVYVKYTGEVEALITAGADINQKNNEGKTALILLITRSPWLITYNKDRLLVDLLTGGALVHIRDNEGNTALDYAIQRNLPPFVQELLKNQLNLENTEFALHLSEISENLPSTSNGTEKVRDSNYLMENVVSFLDGNKKSRKKGKKSRKKKSRQKQKSLIKKNAKKSPK